ncbi:ATP-binding protein [Sphaerisporangium sp. NPDC049003]|uniref:ATP-binding protein n=1 Tax=Sphaerisporangium sp. NPDC049003 TaxID=3364517 RepID=UPI0037210249
MKVDMSQAVTALVVGSFVVAFLALLLWARERRTSTWAHKRADELKAGLQAWEEELGYLVSDRLPRLMNALLVQRGPVPGLRDERLRGTRFAGNIEAIMGLFEAAAGRYRQHADHAVRDTLGGIIGQTQALIGEQEVALRAMQHRHENPDVLRDLLTLDHLNAQMTRKTQGLGVLCGKWVGRQRDASTLTDVVRGAITKIADYTRVRYDENDKVAVSASAVEAVVLSLAEFLENATRRSEPNAPVQVRMMTAYNGVAINVEDSGIGMTDQQVEQGRELLSGRRPVDITRLGDPPRIGFAAIAALAGNYGFSAHLNGQSSSGGLSATIFVPSALLIPVEQPLPHAGGAGAASATPVPMNESGLPQRRRRTGAPSAAVHVADQQDSPRRTPHEVGDRLGAFQSGTRAGRPVGTESSDSYDR